MIAVDEGEHCCARQGLSSFTVDQFALDPNGDVGALQG